jgi:hypothetical protein
MKIVNPKPAAGIPPATLGQLLVAALAAATARRIFNPKRQRNAP